MRINCTVTGLLRLHLGQTRLQLELDEGATIGDALQTLAQLGELDDRQMSAYMVFLQRDGETHSMNRLQGRETPLRDGDGVTLAYTFSGG